VEKAIAGVADPWKRLEAAAIAHAEAMLDRSGFRVLVTPFFPPGLDAAVRKELVDQRDRFERMMEAVIDDLPLMPNIDRHVFQRHYLGAVNWISVWYNWEGALRDRLVNRIWPSFEICRSKTWPFKSQTIRHFRQTAPGANVVPEG
jgi:hypothetical protein